MIQPLSDFLYALLFSVIVGFAIGILYECIRIFHYLGFSKPCHYFVTDVLFIVFLSLIIYFYCIVTLEGRVRFFVIAGILSGFGIYCYFIAPLTKKLLFPIAKFFREILLNLLKKCNQIMYNVLCRFGHMKVLLKKCIFKLYSRVNKEDESHESGIKRNSEKRRKGFAGSKTDKKKVK